MSNPWDYVPFCPFRPGEECSHRCALAVRIDGDGRFACALTVTAVRGTDHCLNVVFGPEGAR